MPISTTDTTLTLTGPEEPIASLTINGDVINFTAYDGTLESTTEGTSYTMSLAGFENQDYAFYGSILLIADAGDDKIAFAGDKIFLNASSSSTPSGTFITSYRWNQVLGDPVKLVGSKLKECNFVAPSENYRQNLVFELIIFNNLGMEARDNVEVSVVQQNIGGSVKDNNYRHGVYVFEVPTIEN